MSQSETVLQLEGVSVSYGALRAVDGANLSLRQGQIHALLGPSGCGKTTLLRAIAGFERVDEGRIVIGGRLCDDGSAWENPEKRSIGIVFQDYALFSHLDVRANVGFSLRRGEQRRIGEELARVELSHCAARMPAELSGGQQQRIALARALASRPNVLLLDEPFSNLDPGLRDTLRQSTRRLVKEQGVTTLLVTHDAEEALALADTVTVMDGGRFLQTGSPRELYCRPRSLTVARALGPVNALAAYHDVRGVWRCAFGVIPEPVVEEGASAGEALVLLRPESLLVIEEASTHRQADTAVEVLDERFFGATSALLVRSPEGVEATMRVSGEVAERGMQRALCVRIAPCCAIVSSES